MQAATSTEKPKLAPDAFMAALAIRPALYSRLSDIVALVIGGVGTNRNINLAEEQVIEMTRSLGNEALTSYAQQVAATATAEAQSCREYENLGKKKSTSTLHSVK